MRDVSPPIIITSCYWRSQAPLVPPASFLPVSRLSDRATLRDDNPVAGLLDDGLILRRLFLQARGDLSLDIFAN